MFKLAHVSDLHATAVRVERVSDFANKRLLALVSWRSKRKRGHRPHVLDALVQDIEATDPDHVAVTGDVTNASCEFEFEEAVPWLERLGGPQRVSVVPGNHDELGTFMVGEVLSAMFANDALVTIDNRPMLRKYHSYGNVLLGFTHGGEEKHAELPSIMADEARDLWAKADHREWHIGHFHKKKELRFVGLDAFRTTVVRVLPSLCGTDAWHYKKGYKHTPQAQAFVWHPEDGLADTLTHTPKP